MRGCPRTSRSSKSSAQLEDGAENTRLVARTEARNSPAQGDRVTLKVRPDEAHVFDPETGERLEPS